MNIGFVILCRYNSSRLPGKILKKISGKPILMYIIERLIQVIPIENIVVATSTEESDNPIAEYCKENQINVFRGSLNNVALRFLKCAEKYNFDYTTRINGDNIFVDIQTLKEMCKLAESRKYDFISNVKNRTFPKGMSIEIIRTSFLKEGFKNFNKDEYFEHVTLYFYENDKGQNFYYFYNNICPEAAGLQMAIDTEADFNTIENIIKCFSEIHTNYGLKEIFFLYNNESGLKTPKLRK